MKCPNCQEPLNEGDVFCGNCGKPVSKEKKKESFPSSNPVQQTQNNTISGNGSIFPRWLVAIAIPIGVVLCCGAAAIGGFLVYSGQTDRQAKNNTLSSSTKEPGGNKPATAVEDDVPPGTNPDMKTDEPNQGQESTPEMVSNPADLPNIHQNGLKIWFDDSLMQGVKLVKVDRLEPGGYVPWDYHPEHYSIEIQNPAGVIHFVPLNTYMPMGEFADDTMVDLVNTLDVRPTVKAWGCMPNWLYPCPHQEMNINLKYFDFQNGSGFRTVTVFAIQNTSAINNRAIDYYYNGLTSDENIYVFANFDLRHTSLTEDDWDLPLEVMTDMTGETLKEYVITFGQELEASSENYQPQLKVLDDAIRSIRIELK